MLLMDHIVRSGYCVKLHYTVVHFLHWHLGLVSHWTVRRFKVERAVKTLSCNIIFVTVYTAFCAMLQCVFQWIQKMTLEAFVVKTKSCKDTHPTCMQTKLWHLCLSGNLFLTGEELFVSTNCDTVTTYKGILMDNKLFFFLLALMLWRFYCYYLLLVLFSYMVSRGC